MKIAILGFGDQGKSAYEYWGRPENEITICDSSHEVSLPKNVQSQLGVDYLKNLERFDLIVRSPSIHPKDIEASSPGVSGKTTSVTNEFFRICPTKNIIGVTGTKGKGTTSTLITKMLTAAGKRVHLGGNIGVPPLEMLKNDIQPDDWVVLELANFQLIDLKYSPHIAVCLMIASEHQDWHKDFEEYTTAKQQLFSHQTENDIAVYNADDQNSVKIAFATHGTTIGYMHPTGAFVEYPNIKIYDEIICAVQEIKLLGQHNWQNVCASVTAVWQVTQDVEAIRSVVTTFSGMENRLELIRDLDGVKYYNDSFGTTPETAIVAIEAFTEPKVLILGGSDKGADFTALARTIVKSNVRYAIIIGDTGPKIATAIEATGSELPHAVFQSITMKEIVTMAKDRAEAGDVVLLSTGCASFGLFKNYKDRGEQFNEAVRQLS